MYTNTNWEVKTTSFIIKNLYPQNFTRKNPCCFIMVSSFIYLATKYMQIDRNNLEWRKNINNTCLAWVFWRLSIVAFICATVCLRLSFSCSIQVMFWFSFLMLSTFLNNFPFSTFSFMASDWASSNLGYKKRVKRLKSLNCLGLSFQFRLKLLTLNSLPKAQIKSLILIRV